MIVTKEEFIKMLDNNDIKELTVEMRMIYPKIECGRESFGHHAPNGYMENARLYERQRNFLAMEVTVSIPSEWKLVAFER